MSFPAPQPYLGLGPDVVFCHLLIKKLAPEYHWNTIDAISCFYMFITFSGRLWRYSAKPYVVQFCDTCNLFLYTLFYRMLKCNSCFSVFIFDIEKYLRFELSAAFIAASFEFVSEWVNVLVSCSVWDVMVKDISFMLLLYYSYTTYVHVYVAFEISWIFQEF